MIENILRIATNQTNIKTTWIKLSIGLSFKESTVLKNNLIDLKKLLIIQTTIKTIYISNPRKA